MATQPNTKPPLRTFPLGLAWDAALAERRRAEIGDVASAEEAKDVRRRVAALRRWLGKRSSYRPEELPPRFRPDGKDRVPTNEELTRVELRDWLAEPERKGGPGKWMAYLARDSEGRAVVTTFTGAILAYVSSLRTRPAPLGSWLSSERGTFRAIGTNGVEYVGNHNGEGIYCRLRPAKTRAGA